jgi:hypothetical protein
MMYLQMAISGDIRTIVEYELAHGNEITRIDQPAGTKCPLAVILRFPFRIRNSGIDGAIPLTVAWWEYEDPHYPADWSSGFKSIESSHAVAAPLR